MSAASDGAAAIHVPGPTGRTVKNEMCRKRDFELVCSQPVESKAVIEAIVSLVQPPQLLEGLQQINNRKYIVSFKSEAGAESFFGLAPQLSIPGTSVYSKWLGAEFKKIKVAFLPLAVPNEELAAVLRRYGRVLHITDELHQGSPVPLKTGTRLVDMEMTVPVPNMISVHGFNTTVTYRGVVIQCRRCLQTGHLKADCNVSYCDRCRSFGHTEAVCVAPCLKCKSPEHHWRACSVRNYAFATGAATSAETSLIPVAVDPLVGSQAQEASCAAAASDAVVKELMDYMLEDTVAGYTVTSSENGPVSPRAAFGGAKTAAEPAPVAIATVAAETPANPVTFPVTEIHAKIVAAANAGEPVVPASASGCLKAAAAPVTAAAASESAEQVDVGVTCLEDDVRARFTAEDNRSRSGQLVNNELLAAASIPDEEQTNNAGKESAEHVSHAGDAPKHLEWKRAITRSKRKLLTCTPGQSPLYKKSATDKQK